MEFPDRRKAERFKGYIPIELKQETAQACNISTDGVYFVTEQSLCVGEQIEFFMVLEHSGLGPGVRLRCRGEVLRTERMAGKTGVAAAATMLLLEEAPPQEVM